MSKPQETQPARMTPEALQAVIEQALNSNSELAALREQVTQDASQDGDTEPNGDQGRRFAAAAAGGTPVAQGQGRQVRDSVQFALGVSPAVHNQALQTPPAYASAAPPPRDQLFPGQALAQFVRVLTASQNSIKTPGGYRTPVQIATQTLGESHHVTAAFSGAYQAAIDSTSASKGAILIPPGFSTDFIELLRPRTVFLAAGPQYVLNPTGNLPIPKQTGGASAGYVTEGKPLPVTEASFGQENAVSKHLGCITVISNVWLERADAGSDQMIINDLLNGGSQKLDLVGLRSTGGGGEPKGLRYWAHVDNIVAASNPAGGDSAAVVAQKIESTYQAMWLAIATGNVSLTRPHAFMSSRTFSYLHGLRDGNGNLIYRNELNRGFWGQFPVSWTNQIPDDLGGGGDESEIILANMDDVVFADEQAISVDVGEHAIEDGASVKALWSRNQSAVKLNARHDVIARHSKGIAVAKGVTWGTV